MIDVKHMMQHKFYGTLSLVMFMTTVTLSACGGGGGGGDGGNNSQTLVESRDYIVNIRHNDTITESYTLSFSAADRAVSSSFTMYLWNPELVDSGTATQPALTVSVYTDGNTPETCTPIWSANNMATCQFTAVSNATNLNLDITNSSGADVSYEYTFLPGTTTGDGSVGAPFQITSAVISDANAATEGSVANTAGSSSYYKVNTGSADTFEISPLIALNATQSTLGITLYSDSGYASPIYTCADLSGVCGNITGLSQHTDYYLKVTSNGTTTSDFIIYQLDFYASIAPPAVDHGITVNFGYGVWSDGYKYSVYMFDSNGIAVAGLWTSSATFSNGAVVKLKTLDANGCITTTDASEINTGTYTFVSTVRDPATSVSVVKPDACAGTDGFIINTGASAGQGGQSLTYDMANFASNAYMVNLNSDATAYLDITADTGTTSNNSLYCSVYDGNYAGSDDKYRMGYFQATLVSGTVNAPITGNYLPLSGSYKMYCYADIDASGTVNTGDKEFTSTFILPSVGSSYTVDATNTASWTTVP